MFLELVLPEAKIPNLKPQIPQISQIKRRTEDGLCQPYIFVPDAFL